VTFTFEAGESTELGQYELRICELSGSEWEKCEAELGRSEKPKAKFAFVLSFSLRTPGMFHMTCSKLVPNSDGGNSDRRQHFRHDQIHRQAVFG